MRYVLAVISALGAWAASDAMAAEATMLSVRQTIGINAPPAAVWAVVGDFNGLPSWFSRIVDSRIVSGNNNEVGCIRELTRRNGTQVTERLVEYDPVGMRLSYTYIGGMVAASDYFPVIVVKDAGNGTSTVDWSARFRRLAYWLDPPPAGQDDKSLTDFFSGAYQAGLEALKKKLEGGQ